MTMTSKKVNPERVPRQAALANIRGEVVDLSFLLSGEAHPGVAWSAVSQDPAQGLRGTIEDHHAQASLDRTSFSIREMSSVDAPADLRDLVRSTYIRYLNACLTVGAFAFEAVPIQNMEGKIQQDSLSMNLARRGAEWLAELPRKETRTPHRLPALSELTVIDTPPPITSKDTHPNDGDNT